MKKLGGISILLCAFVMTGLAGAPLALGDTTDQQWKELLVAAQGGNWTDAVKLSTQYLKEMKDDDDRLPRLRYIYLYSAAGAVSEGKMSYGQLEENLKDFIGKRVVLPYHPIADAEDKGALSVIRASGGKNDRLFVAAANESGTTVHSFEYIQLKEPFNLKGHEGELATISGVIDSIEPNPNKSDLLIMRIHISDGLLKLKG
jgi:hypothetical protein